MLEMSLIKSLQVIKVREENILASFEPFETVKGLVDYV